MSNVNYPGFPSAGPSMGAAPESSGKKGKGPKEPKTPTPRGARRWLVGFVVAVVVAGIVFVVSSKPVPSTYVVRTNTAVAAFTHPDAATQLEVVKIDPKDVVQGAVTGTSVKDAEDKAIAQFKLNDPTTTTSFPLAKGQQLTPDVFSPIPKPLNTQLNGQLRVMSIHAVAPSALAGQLRSGDSVDVIAVDQQHGAAKVVETNIKIVSVGTETTGVQAARPSASASASPVTGDSAQLPTVYVVLASGSQAAELALYDTNYKLYLVYRGVQSDELPTTTFISPTLPLQ